METKIHFNTSFGDLSHGDQAKLRRCLTVMAEMGFEILAEFSSGEKMKYSNTINPRKEAMEKTGV